MTNTTISIISKELQIPYINVNNVINLFNDKATVPFIARYRKEMTGSLDEVAILKIKEKFHKLTELEKRKESILNSIEEQGKLTDELKALIANTYDASELEDIYLPFKQKRKTKATIAKEKGLEPLAKMIIKEFDNIEKEIKKYLNKDVVNEEDAINGAKDIVAEWINENAYVRKKIRNIYENEAKISTKVIKGKEEEGNNFKDYFEYTELLRKCPSHRFLAIKRGQSEGFINYKIQPEEGKALFEIERIIIKKNNTATDYLQAAIKDSYKRLIHPSVENEIDGKFKELSDIESIKVFAENIRQLLLSPPLGKKRVLAIDPGFRTGCKVVCLDETGKLLHNDTIYPHPPQEDMKLASKKISSMVDAYKIDAIAIGNGTAGRETEYFIKKLKFNKDIKVFVVSEAGASIYSASAIAREEFPQYDVTVRGAVSIGRRLMDPLAELVKIDPESIGVGQYQHDVDHKFLKESLDNVVESCVNQVGVNLNTASKHLLQYVSGLGPQIAQNIIDYRNENGEFKSRKELQKINRLGSKA
ncbi:MAG: RNA-binding transcriptional accessory protein, partial [Bacteroidetes bacterium GWA2_31_9]